MDGRSHVLFDPAMQVFITNNRMVNNQIAGAMLRLMLLSLLWLFWSPGPTRRPVDAESSSKAPVYNSQYTTECVVFMKIRQ